MNSPDNQTTQAKFSVGELVHHRLFNYRGVIVDADPNFMLSDEWYEQIARSRPPRDQPWYRVLVHNSNDETYVAERNLTHDSSSEPIAHPLINAFFTAFDGSRYVSGQKSN
ncbi:MAG: heat shock protein HspQ [Candidatus Thiodiazotropha sp. (ex Notomyrtea botanica)]|nr:heat shock protein HspQ [Candidatus Thiodiazotropha sp. (ex Notomyrtea botanica)]